MTELQEVNSFFIGVCERGFINGLLLLLFVCQNKFREFEIQVYPESMERIFPLIHVGDWNISTPVGWIDMNFEPTFLLQLVYTVKTHT